MSEKKEYDIKPNLRQKKAVVELMANGGNLGDALKKAGYSDSVSKRPKQVTQTKGFKELLEEYLPDELLQKVHLEGLMADKAEHGGGTIEDYPTRHKYLDTAYKLKGAYAAEKLEISTPKPLLGGDSNNNTDGTSNNNN